MVSFMIAFNALLKKMFSSSEYWPLLGYSTYS